jgi:type I restriction enzyme S subunit
MEAIKQVEAAINAAHREIHLVREYRTRLIADVVTGKLDVREAAARLPAETEGPESIESIDEIEADVDVEAYTADEIDAVPEEAEA